MKITYLTGDLFKLADEYGAQYIAHGVNCQGAMRSGVAKQARELYPDIFTAYKEACVAAGEPSRLLGKVQEVVISPKRSILNCFTQLHYGYGGAQYVDYAAIASCITAIDHTCKHKTVFMPKIGAGLGGGDWVTISKLIEELAETFNPVVVALP